MENVTDRESNPFGMNPPCKTHAVPGYGDANADFHVIGDNPQLHGGVETGVPFTGSEAGERIQSVLHETGFVDSEYSDAPNYENVFTNYIHACADEPTRESYARLERYFDAELRAINAHILLPVGKRTTRHALAEYTTQLRKLEDSSMEDLHATEIRGRGFLVIPVSEPADWDGEGDALVQKLKEVLMSDYRQTKGVATRIG
ncbi:MAG: uracil-DNA glycosylase family protein [Halobacteria archaeon]|nr:uracil-DNA glycosylase family protein [Halobacteria archaeon]